MKPLLMSVNMQAGNLGVDTFQIAGEEVQVHNVEIRKKGLLSSNNVFELFLLYPSLIADGLRHL